MHERDISADKGIVLARFCQEYPFALLQNSAAGVILGKDARVDDFSSHSGTPTTNLNRKASRKEVF